MNFKYGPVLFTGLLATEPPANHCQLLSQCPRPPGQPAGSCKQCLRALPRHHLEQHENDSADGLPRTTSAWRCTFSSSSLPLANVLGQCFHGAGLPGSLQLPICVSGKIIGETVLPAMSRTRTIDQSQQPSGCSRQAEAFGPCFNIRIDFAAILLASGVRSGAQRKFHSFVAPRLYHPASILSDPLAYHMAAIATCPSGRAVLSVAHGTPPAVDGMVSSNVSVASCSSRPRQHASPFPAGFEGTPAFFCGPVGHGNLQYPASVPHRSFRT